MKKQCACGTVLLYAKERGIVILQCSNCGRHYSLGYTYNDKETSLPLDVTDRKILSYLCAESCCTPLEICALFDDEAPSYDTVLRKVQRLARHGYVEAQKRKNGRWIYYATEKLESLNRGEK
jgi:DNA-binding transcriptional ArsR family regulator